MGTSRKLKKLLLRTSTKRPSSFSKPTLRSPPVRPKKMTRKPRMEKTRRMEKRKRRRCEDTETWQPHHHGGCPPTRKLREKRACRTIEKLRRWKRKSDLALRFEWTASPLKTLVTQTSCL